MGFLAFIYSPLCPHVGLGICPVCLRCHILGAAGKLWLWEQQSNHIRDEELDSSRFPPLEALPPSATELFLPLIFQIINHLCPQQ